MRLKPELYRNRNFVLYSAGNAVSWLGLWGQRIGIGWLSWDLSHAPFWVGIVSLAQFVPLIVSGPLFGAILDRTDRKRYALVTNAVLATLALCLYGLTALNLMNIALLTFFGVLLGIANSAYQPIRLVLINEIVRKEDLAAAIAAHSIIFNLTRSIGPALAGLVIAAFGLPAAFAFNAISYFAILGALGAMHFPVYVARGERRHFFVELWAGVHYVIHQPQIRELMLLSAVTSILGRSILELMPVFADSVFHRGSAGLAALTTATGCGAIGGAIGLSVASNHKWLPWLARQGALWLGLLFAVFGLCTRYEQALAMVVLLGTAVVLCSVGLQVILQSTIEDAYRGRVLSLWGMVNIAGPGVGAAALGGFAQWIDLTRVTVASGVVCSCLVFAILIRGRRPIKS
jgi:MFS family permease